MQGHVRKWLVLRACPRIITGMNSPPVLPLEDARYPALKARYDRFDGHFYIGVTSTGIYCCPVSRERAPKRKNCRFLLTHNKGMLGQGIHIKLAYRPQYDVDAMLQFFATRRVTGIEDISQTTARQWMGKTVPLTCADVHYTGWLTLEFESARCRVNLQVRDSLQDALPVLLAWVRSLSDLDADPAAINSLPHDRFLAGDDLSVPGTLDDFELAVRAVLGQQITVAADRIGTAASGALRRTDRDAHWGIELVFPEPGTDNLNQRCSAPKAAIARRREDGQQHGRVEPWHSYAVLRAWPMLH